MRRKIAALAVLIVVFGGVGLPTAAGDPPDDLPGLGERPEPGRPEPDQGDSEGSVGPDADLLGGLLLSDVATAVQTALGGRYGQLMVAGEGDDAVLRVAVTDVAVDDEEVLGEVTGLGDRVEVVPTSHSEAVLQMYLDAATAMLPRSKLWAMGPQYEFNASEAVASVKIVSVEFTDEEKRRLREVVPPELLVIDEDPEFTVEPTHANRNVYPPYEGGLRAEYVLANNCTTNFVHVNGFGSFGTSAGHCAPSATWNTHPIRMGTYATQLRANYYWNQAGNETWSDTAMWIVPTADRTARILANSDQQFHRTVDSRFNGNPGLINVCRQGITTDGGGSCANMYVNSWRFTDENGILHRYHDCMNGVSLLGDSGGPVYHRPDATHATAAGSVWGNLMIDGALRTCLSRVQYAVLFHGEIFMQN